MAVREGSDAAEEEERSRRREEGKGMEREEG